MATAATATAAAATTIQYFPSLRNYTNKITISRNRRPINVADFIYEWINEYDADDYLEVRRNEGYSRLNYYIIIYILLNHQQLFLNNLTKA